jgi:hypothetical protein
LGFEGEDQDDPLACRAWGKMEAVWWTGNQRGAMILAEDETGLYGGVPLDYVRVQSLYPRRHPGVDAPQTHQNVGGQA